MEMIEGVGESSSPPRSFGGYASYNIRSNVYRKLLDSGYEEAVTNPAFREELDAHFSRLPVSYGVDVNMDRVEDVLLHRQLLERARDPQKRPVYHVRFMEVISIKMNRNEDPQPSRKAHISSGSNNSAWAGAMLHIGFDTHADNGNDFAPCTKLENLNLSVKNITGDASDRNLADLCGRQVSWVILHEIIFVTVDKPKLLSQISAILSDMGLNIREAHVFSTTDGYSLAVFVVEGWPVKDVSGLYEALEEAIARKEGSWSGTSSSHPVIERVLTEWIQEGDWEIDRQRLMIGEKLTNVSYEDVYHGTYNGLDVAVKVFKFENLTEAVVAEFVQEVNILRGIRHKNIVLFIGASTKLPELCIVTEYMPGGSLYDYVHKSHNLLGLSSLLDIAVDICEGMVYLHEKNIIHRDLKSANLLMDDNNVVKVADFGVARFRDQGGLMTAETGTYRWMAPEVISHQLYDQKADVFSFAIVLWELMTGKIPYKNLTPLQAAMGVRLEEDISEKKMLVIYAVRS